ncbi:MAG: sulfite exporter TauE/SafE family protein [Phycisphaeraceae bacterium]
MFELDAVLNWGPILAIAAVGLVAGTLGGLLGVGGSVIMIPALTVLFARNQHLYQATAMLANIAVAVPSMLRHRRAGVLVADVLAWMLPASLVFVLVGVWVSNLWFFEGRTGGIWLGRILAAFLVYVIIQNVRKIIRYKPLQRDEATITPVRSGSVGGIMGSLAGLLGIGGGAVAVPLQQVILKLPLRNCIGNSAAVICFSATIGAIYKNASLAQHGYDWKTSLLIAGLLAPTGWLGGRLGASLTHQLPVRQVRIAFILMIAVAAWKMAAIPGSPL